MLMELKMWKECFKIYYCTLCLDRISVDRLFQTFGQAPKYPNRVCSNFLRIGGGQLELRLHSPNSQITELEKFGEL